MIENQSELMSLLKIIQSFQLNDCWLCTETIRNHVWNFLSGKDRSGPYSAHLIKNNQNG